MFLTAVQGICKIISEVNKVIDPNHIVTLNT